MSNRQMASELVVSLLGRSLLAGLKLVRAAGPDTTRDQSAR